MDELMRVIERYTEGNYLIGKTTREEMAKDILALLRVRLSFVDWLKENEPLLVNHGGKLNVHEIEQRYNKYINEA